MAAKKSLSPTTTKTAFEKHGFYVTIDNEALRAGAGIQASIEKTPEVSPDTAGEFSLRSFPTLASLPAALQRLHQIGLDCFSPRMSIELYLN